MKFGSQQLLGLWDRFDIEMKNVPVASATCQWKQIRKITISVLKDLLLEWTLTAWFGKDMIKSVIVFDEGGGWEWGTGKVPSNLDNLQLTEKKSCFGQWIRPLCIRFFAPCLWFSRKTLVATLPTHSEALFQTFRESKNSIPLICLSWRYHN